MTFSKTHLAIIASVVVAVSACILGIGLYAVTRMNQSAQSALFKGQIDAYLAMPKEQPEQGAYVKGKIVVVDVREKAVDGDVFFALPAALRAAGPDEVGTVVQVKWGVTFPGHFVNQAGQDLGVGSACTGEVTVIDKSIPAILERRTFQSKAVVRGIDGGAKPIDEIVDYLAKLPREAAREEPVPKGWLVLFRSDDASVWNKDSPGDKFALPVRRAHSTIRHLRLKRTDTGEYLILPITSRQLASDGKPESGDGCWWNGTGQHGWGGHHLGLCQVPPMPIEAKGVIGISGWATGSGFGHKLYVDDKQYYCWQGREIPKTAFEIAVTADLLTDEERLRLLAPDGNEGPAPAGWTVLFRSDDPLDWNTVRSGEKFAVPLSQAHSAIRHLRLKRIDTGEFLVIPITRKQLGDDGKPDPKATAWWSGACRPASNARQLGIAQLPAVGGDQGEIIGLAREGGNVFMGSGFGWKTHVEDRQYCSWLGAETPRTVFEIAVSAGPLTDQEKSRLPEALPAPLRILPSLPPATPIANAIPQPEAPPAVAGKKTIDLVPLFDQKKDVALGRWVVVKNTLHCNDMSNVPRIQFPYEPPQEYDYIVTFSQPTLRNGVSLVMPNPKGGMFHFGFGFHGGWRYDLHGSNFGTVPNMLSANKAYTVTVQVRRDGVKALLDGKELLAHKTDFRDLTCDGYRDMPNKKFLALACDDPTVFHYVQVVEITGAGKPGR
jgi:hypothetical protein